MVQHGTDDVKWCARRTAVTVDIFASLLRSLEAGLGFSVGGDAKSIWLVSLTGSKFHAPHWGAVANTPHRLAKAKAPSGNTLSTAGDSALRIPRSRKVFPEVGANLQESPLSCTS